MSKHKNYILHILEQGYLNHEWALLHLLAHLSEDEAQKFCEQHDLHDCTPLWETTPERTVGDAINDLYERRMAELDTWMNDDDKENNHG
jgi:hypothetical protein